MRTQPLLDLAAEFFRDLKDGRVELQGLNADRAHGLWIRCPCGRPHSFGVWFSNPIGAQPSRQDELYHRIGNELVTLTLGRGIRRDCWHGRIEHGEAVTT